MSVLGLLLTLIVGVFIYGGSLCSIKYTNNKKFIDFSISMAFGVLVVLSILEILPEAYEILNGEIGSVRSIIAIILLILIYLFFLLQSLFLFPLILIFH